jgi:hypothetical protein
VQDNCEKDVRVRRGIQDLYGTSAADQLVFELALIDQWKIIARHRSIMGIDSVTVHYSVTIIDDYLYSIYDPAL